MRLYGILVTYRRPRELAEALLRVAEQLRPVDELILVDNAADPRSEVVLEAYRAGGRSARYVAAPENLGPAGGIALGMEHVLDAAEDDDWVVTLDDDDPLPDVEVMAHLEAFALAMLASDGHTGAVGLVGARFDWRTGRLARLGDRELTGPVAVDYIGGNHCPFIRVEALRKVGPFRAELFFGLDDLDFGLRLRRAGYAIYVDGARWRDRRARGGRLGVELVHDRRLQPLGWRRYYSLRNAIHILRANGRPGTAARVALLRGFGKPLANLFRSPGEALRHLQLNWRACRDGWTDRMGRTVEPDGAPGP